MSKVINIKIPFTDNQTLWIIGIIVLALNTYSVIYQYENQWFIIQNNIIPPWSFFSIGAEIALIWFMLHDQIPRYFSITFNVKFRKQEVSLT